MIYNSFVFLLSFFINFPLSKLVLLEYFTLVLFPLLYVLIDTTLKRLSAPNKKLYTTRFFTIHPRGRNVLHPPSTGKCKGFHWLFIDTILQIQRFGYKFYNQRKGIFSPSHQSDHDLILLIHEDIDINYWKWIVLHSTFYYNGFVFSWRSLDCLCIIYMEYLAYLCLPPNEDLFFDSSGHYRRCTDLVIKNYWRLASWNS